MDDKHHPKVIILLTHLIRFRVIQWEYADQ